jgi:hypothetical protein
LENIQDAQTQDRKWTAVDQSYGIYTHTCTMMSAYSAILSLFNLEPDEEFKKMIVENAQKK